MRAGWMFSTRPMKSLGIGTSCRNPAMQTSSAPAPLHRPRMRSPNSAGVALFFRSTTAVGSPARAARSSPATPGLLETTRTMCAFSRPSAIRSIRFCRVVPLPLSSTARRRGDEGIMQLPAVSEQSLEVVLRQLPDEVAAQQALVARPGGDVDDTGQDGTGRLAGSVLQVKT